MNRTISKILCIVLIFTAVAIPASAQGSEPTIDKEAVIEAEINLDDKNAEVRELSIGEAALFVKNAEGISYSEAIAEVMDNIQRGTGYQEVTIEKNFGETASGVWYADWTIEVGAVYQTATGSGHSNFVGDPIEVWSAAISSGAYTWKESYSPIATIVGNTSTSVRLQCRGIVTVEYTTASEMGFDLSVLPDVLGFTYSTSTSGTYYYRKTGSISGTYTMGQ